MRNNLKSSMLRIRVEPRLLARIDQFRAEQRIPPNRSATVIHIIEDWLDAESMHSGLTSPMGERRFAPKLRKPNGGDS